MIVATEVTLAMRCPACGKLAYHSISRFALPGGRALEINCSCGTLKLAVTALKDGRYGLTVPCIVCGGRHPFTVSGRQLWSGNPFELYCRQTGIELAWLGSADEVRRATHASESRLETFINDFIAADYFHNSTIMFAVLKWLRTLGERGMVFCRCGNSQIEVDIFPDRLELHCPDCNRIHIIYAETEADLHMVEGLSSLQLDGEPQSDRPEQNNKVHSFPRHHHRY